jgi:hypothetical protein
MREHPPDIASQSFINLLPKDLMDELAKKTIKSRRLHYNQPKESVLQPEELIISGSLNHHRLLDDLKRHHENSDWKAFYQVAEKVLRVKTNNPIVRTILSEESGPIHEEDEVSAEIARYFKEVYAKDS